MRTQGSRPRPRTQKKSEAKDRNAQGQGQEPRTQAQVLSKKKKKRSSQKFFRQSPQKNVFQKIFQPLHKILTIQKIVLSSSRGQANFRGLEASRPRPRTSKCVIIIIIIIIFIYLPSDVISQEKKLQLPLGLSPKHRNMQFL